LKNPLGFAWEIGQYENPKVVVRAVGPPPAAIQLACPGRTVIYASRLEIVGNCQGFVGFGGGNPWANPVVMTALRRAAAYVPKVTCANPCNRVASLIWVGWDCGANPLSATGGVEIAVECVVPNPAAIKRFREACRGLGELPAPIFRGRGWAPPQRATTSKRKRPRGASPVED
jgi:hypothetical protein